MSSQPVPIAIIGGGIFVKEQHLPAVLATSLLHLKIIYSRSLASAKETHKLLPLGHSPVEVYSEDSEPGRTFADVLARKDILGVIIALPIASQPSYVEAALKAGKHVLSEKPVGPDVEGAKKLVQAYRAVVKEQGVSAPMWSIAEQFRFLPKFVWAAEQARGLGKVIGFHFKVFQLCKEDNKYFQTAWRKNPTHSYGFLLDGGVHSTAAIRMFLGDEKPASVVGYSFLAQKHLAPVDTLGAIIKTKSGAVGSFSCSWGTTIPRQAEYQVACENGSVTIDGDKGWVVYKDGRKEEKDFPFTVGAGVREEVHAWGLAMAGGKEDPLLTPEVTLGDLELLEQMLKSADEDGAAKTLQLQ
ncbi:NAD(P)-binding protein [Cryphonectria parasitica EP155]|uniref:NAD(P)-binding protein n=1 Tax=Cryphonectria parasitica (strain ATCC 38755 / EP155) TaxID=660469 RepID=A0A9P4XT55_CRYP1|nr:NAD(P)-binding protein [Cryphonectria parasitica EP155]KAF3760824.1 NAD(P)-binding protein [Cryphonectria parasitica EP155]